MILPRDQLSAEVARRQAAGERGAFSNGCFDLLHVGHLRSLQAARARGDFLIVGVNSDASVRALKGPGRPLVPEDERCELLDGLACVDYVCLFDELTVDRLIDAVRPAVFVKSVEYEHSTLPEFELVRAYGGELHFVEIVPGRSTSSLVERLRTGG